MVSSNSRAGRPLRKASPSTMKGFSWETKFESNSLMAVGGPPSTMENLVLASSADSRATGRGLLALIVQHFTRLTSRNRECPNHGGNTRRGGHHSDAPLIDRIQPSRDHSAPRDYPPYRGDDFSRNYPPPRDKYYDYYQAPPPARDYRRPATPPRDYPPGPPPRRDYDDFRVRGPPPARYDTRSYYPESDGPAPYPPNRNYTQPANREIYDRRGPPPERYPPYPPPSSGRRSPPPARGRDDFDRPPPR